MPCVIFVIKETVMDLLMYFLCHLNGAFFTASQLQWNPIAPSMPQKNPSLICPINLINKTITVSININRYGKLGFVHGNGAERTVRT